MFSTINTNKLLLWMFMLLISILIHYYINNGYNLTLESEKCPFCYGDNYCNVLNDEITFENLTITEKISNLINIKNVYIANHNGTKVVLKKLGHTRELDDIDDTICKELSFIDNCPPFPESYTKDFTTNVIKLLYNEDRTNVFSLKLCSLSASNQFSNLIFALNSHLNTSVMTANIWTTILANAEPLLLQILDERNNWPVPKYFGACGRVIVEEYCGRTLNSLKDESWITRASVALQLLSAAEDFTNKHSMFRFYLTDISSDNIAVTDDYKVKFIDLENVIIAEKKHVFGDAAIHKSINFEEYAFSSDEICNHGISDHNFYSICKLLLSKKSPWPMMENGLLHSPTNYIVNTFPDVFKYVEICAESSEAINRFEASKRLINILTEIIERENDSEVEVNKTQ